MAAVCTHWVVSDWRRKGLGLAQRIKKGSREREQYMGTRQKKPGVPQPIVSICPRSPYERQPPTPRVGLIPINHHLPTTRGFYLHQTNKPSSTTSALLPPSLGRTWDVQSEKRKTDNLRVYLPKVSVTTTSATLLTYSARSDLLCLTGVGAESIQRLLVRYMQTVGTKN